VNGICLIGNMWGVLVIPRLRKI